MTAGTVRGLYQMRLMFAKRTTVRLLSALLAPAGGAVADGCQHDCE